MALPDVSTENGLVELNKWLADRSYVAGYTPSSNDITTFNKITKVPAASLQHVLRWYNHIKSFSAQEQTKFGGAPACPMKTGTTTTAAKEEEDDDDVDLFGSDNEEESAEAAKIREDRLKAYAEKKNKKPALIAKSSIVFDVKPWDDETSVKDMEKQVRTIQMDGLLWGASKSVPIGYGINKLQIGCVVEDLKVSVDLLVEEIEKFEDIVQSVDIAAFNKI